MIIGTYHIMIDEGLEYGYVTTRELTIFLRVLANEGHNIYYHVSVPLQDMVDIGQSTQGFKAFNMMSSPHLTALGQLLVFVIQATKVE
ncbi:hypothetical protein K3495_g1998 [Podosphaera aphanis]|nr:hypothetical protein K3495_g1998 [Podosphaera aphanis]